MQKSDIEKLRSLPSEGVAQRLGFKVERHKTLCPFHNDHTPSLTFKKNKFRCWSCGESGDTISLVMKVLNKDFLEACRWLADEHNVIIDTQASSPTPPQKGRGEPCFNPERYARFFERPWLNEEARRFLFDERRLDPRVVRWCRLTSWRDKQGVPWLQTPYYDRQGKLIGIQNRNLVKGATPRFRFPSGSQCTIYNLSVLNLLKPGEVLFIAEGCSDCWSLLSAGHKAIAIPSATLLSKKDVNLLQTLSSELSVRYEMYPDRDVPGERLFMQLKEVLPQLVHHQLPPGCKDFSDYYLSVVATRH
jgi:DNA primase